MFDLFEEQAPAAPQETLSLKVAIGIINKVANSKTSLAILNCVNIKGEQDTLTLTATDLDYGVAIQVPNTLNFQGETVVNWKEFVAKYDMVPLASMESYAVDDFPFLPSPEGAEEVNPGFLEAMRTVAYCASKDTTRITLNGAYVHKDGVVVTDGHRLHMIHGEYTSDIIVPVGILKLVPKDSVPTRCLVTELSVHLMFPWGYIVSKVIEGPYPNYRQVIPRGFMHRVSVPVAPLVVAAKKAEALNQGCPRMGLFDGHIWVWDKDGAWHKMSQVELPEGFVLHMNPTYLIASLKGLQGLVTFGCNSPTQAIALNPESVTETRIIMPLRPEGV